MKSSIHNNITDRELIKHYQKAQVWYSKGLNVLSPLRFYMGELLSKIDMYNRLSEDQNNPPFPEKITEEARKALERAEKFFTK